MSLGLLAISVVTGLHAQNVQTPFDVNEVVEQVSGNRKSQELSTGEFLIDTNIVYIPASEEQSYSSVAFDSSNYLVVWQDRRSGFQHCDIYGARVTQSGAVLDPIGITISTAVSYQCAPSVAFDGTDYFVVWHDRRGGSSTDIYGARVNPSGVVLDPEGVIISTAVNDQCDPSIAFGGVNYFVVWQDRRSGAYDDIYGARVSRSGVVLDTLGIAVAAASDYQIIPTIGFDSRNFLVVWMDRRGGTYDVYGARVSQSGIILDPSGITISTAADSQYYPSIAFDGVNYLVVWQDRRSGAYDDIYGTRVSPSGTVLDPSGIAISTATHNQRIPSVAFDGTNYLVVWQDRRSGIYEIYGARMNRSGTVFDSSGIAISTEAPSSCRPSIAFDGVNYLVVWEDARGASFIDIYGVRMSRAGVVLDTTETAISTIVSDQYSSSIAFDGTNYLMLWQDKRNGLRSGSYPDIYGARVSQSGIILDPSGIAIATASYAQQYPSIAFDNTNYLVVWQDLRSGLYDDIYGTRVTQLGTVLDSSGIAISTASYAQWYPSLAFDDTNYLVVWQDSRNGIGPYDDIYGARISQAGLVLDPDGIAISSARRYQAYPSVAFDGTNYLVVWTDSRGTTYDIYCARVSRSGAVLDTGIAISVALNLQGMPSVAFDGTNYLVVWQDARNNTTYDIYGARVSLAGVVLDTSGIPISIAAFDQQYPSVTFDGVNYVVVWQHKLYGESCDVCGAKVAPSGIVIDSFEVSVQSGDQIWPSITYGLNSQCLITYSGWCDSINNHRANTMRIWGKFLPPLGIEENQTSNIKKQETDLQIHPNPFRRQTQIKLSIEQGAKGVGLRVYDVSGRLVKSFPLVPRYSLLATSSIAWDGSDDSGRKLPAGVYFCRLEASGQPLSQKIVKLER